MSKTKARTIASIGIIGLFLAVIGGFAELEPVMWVGVGFISMLGILALISVITGKRLLPSDNEILGG